MRCVKNFLRILLIRMLFMEGLGVRMIKNIYSDHLIFCVHLLRIHTTSIICLQENLTKDKEAYTISGVEPTIFVDDNPLALMAVKRYAPHIITVRMKREEGEHRDKSSGKEVDYEITSLTQLQTF